MGCAHSASPPGVLYVINYPAVMGSVRSLWDLLLPTSPTGTELQLGLIAEFFTQVYLGSWFPNAPISNGKERC